MILGIDTASSYAAVGLCDNGILLGELVIKAVRTHSDILLPMLDDLFKMTGVKKSALSYVAISNGPGSFTGLKIGASVGKAIAKGLNIPIIPVPTLGILAYNVNTGGLICPIEDARRSEVYSAIYKKAGNDLDLVMDSMVVDIHALIDILHHMNEPVTFVGSYKNYSDIIEKSNLCYTFAPAGCNYPHGSGLCLLAETLMENAVHCDAFRPSYIRKPQAERELESKQ